MTNFDFEHCIDCGDLTGKAGEGEDSLYLIDLSEREFGPLCDECYELYRYKAGYREE